MSKVLQKKDITAQDALVAVKQVVCYLTAQRTEASFSSFYTTVVEEAKDLTQAPILPRQRRNPEVQ